MGLAFISASIALLNPASALMVSDDGEKTAYPGDTVEFFITITNNEPYPLDIKLSSDEEYTHSIIPNQFSLFVGESKVVEYNLRIPLNIEPHYRQSVLDIQKKTSYDPLAEWTDGETHSIDTKILNHSSKKLPDSSENSQSWVLILLIGFGSVGVMSYLFTTRYLKMAGFVVAPLYLGERVGSHEDQEVRQSILRVLNEKPGVTTSFIIRRLDKGRSTIRYHLNLLRHGGYLKEGPTGGWFLVGYKGLPLKEPQRRIINEIQAGGYTTSRDLARRTGMSRTNLRYHISRLVEGGWLSPPTT